ncbi:MAG: OmpH family outer membrane protein [Spirochaetota bacterium]
MRLLVHILLVFVAAGCSYPKQMLENPGAEVPVVRYVQLEVLYEYLVSHDGGASSVRNRSEKLYGEIKVLEDQIMKQSDPEKRKELYTGLKKLKKELSDLRNKEKSYKKEFLEKIEDSARHVAKKHGYHLVLNGVDTVLYSNKEYDITREVLREIVSRKIRNAPVNR